MTSAEKEIRKEIRKWLFNIRIDKKTNPKRKEFNSEIEALESDR